MPYGSVDYRSRLPGPTAAGAIGLALRGAAMPGTGQEEVTLDPEGQAALLAMFGTAPPAARANAVDGYARGVARTINAPPSKPVPDVPVSSLGEKVQRFITSGGIGGQYSILNQMMEHERLVQSAMVGGLAAPPSDMAVAESGLGVASNFDFTGTVGLDMSKAARMARAAEQGFHERDFYHAADVDFFEFDPGVGGGFWDKVKATFLTDKPEVADTYLGGGWVNAKSEHPSVRDVIGSVEGDVARYYTTGSNVLKVKARIEDFDVWDMGGGAYNVDFVHKALKEAKKDKKKGVVFENMRDPGIMSFGAPKASTIVAAFRPRDVRSVHAAFDPKKRTSKNLLAGVAAGGLVAGSVTSGEAGR